MSIYGIDKLTAGCCGVLEWANFVGADLHDIEDAPSTKYADAHADSFEKLLETICKAGQGYMNHIHFAKYKNWQGEHQSEYEWDELRQLIQKIPNVIHMGEFKNPNSGNMVDSYCWYNPKE